MADRSWDFAQADRLVPGTSSMVGYRSTGVPTGIHRGLPSSRLTLILSLDDGVEAAAERELLPQARAQPLLLAGLHTRTSHVRQRTGQTGVQLAVHPLAARRLLGAPSSELSTGDFDGSDLLGPRGRQVWERLTEAEGWDEAFALVSRFLLRQDPASGGVRAEVAEAWRLLERSGGRARVEQVAARVGLTPRRLGTLFHQEVGRSPKTVAMLIRFEHAVATLAGDVRRLDVDLARTATACGYSDQAHLSRDFVRFAQIPPRAWIEEELDSLRAGGHDRRAGPDRPPRRRDGSEELHPMGG